MNVNYSFLSDEELISTLTMNKSTGASLYSTLGSLKNIFMNSSELDLSKALEFEEDRISQIKAIKELIKRIYQPEFLNKYKVNSPQDIYDLVFAEVAYEDVKVFGIILLDSRCQVISKEVVSRGSLGIALLDSRLVFTPAIKKRATKVVIFTNGTANICTPEQIDFDLSNKLIDTGNLLGIPIIEYLLITPGNFFSFQDKGLL